MARSVEHKRLTPKVDKLYRANTSGSHLEDGFSRKPYSAAGTAEERGPNVTSAT